MTKITDDKNFDQLATAWDLNEKYVLKPREELSRLLVQLSDLNNNGKLLDFGTGAGEPGISAAQKFPGAKVIGVDISESMLSNAKKRALRSKVSNIDFIQKQSAKLPFIDEYFSSCIASFSLEYCQNIKDEVTEISRVLSSGSKVVFSMWIDSVDSNPFQSVIPMAIREVSGRNTDAHSRMFLFSDILGLKKELPSNFRSHSEQYFSGFYIYCDFEEFWSLRLKLSPALSSDIKELSLQEIAEVKKLTKNRLHKYVQDFKTFSVPYQCRIYCLQKIS